MALPTMEYKTPAGRIFDVVEVLDQPFYSKVAAPTDGSAQQSEKSFFTEEGKATDRGNMETPNQFSGSQSMIVRLLQIDIVPFDEDTPFDDTLVTALTSFLSKTILQIDKNRGQQLIVAINCILVSAMGPAVEGWDSLKDSLRGFMPFNEPLVFGPAVPFQCTTKYFGNQDISEIDVLITMWGFLGIERTVYK